MQQNFFLKKNVQKMQYAHFEHPWSWAKKLQHTSIVATNTLWVYNVVSNIFSIVEHQAHKNFEIFVLVSHFFLRIFRQAG